MSAVVWIPWWAKQYTTLPRSTNKVFFFLQYTGAGQTRCSKTKQLSPVILLLRLVSQLHCDSEG